MNMLASFTIPMQISNGWPMFLWIVPLVLAISLTYKATKLPDMRAGRFLRESIVLTGTIIAFMIFIAIVLTVVAYIFTR
jgi:hypothetical protein